MPPISEALAIALQHHQSGRLLAAEQIYRQILQADPNQSDALHLLGLIAHRVGKHEIAVECMERALRLNGTVADYHYNLGLAHGAMHNLERAIPCYRRALELRPDFAAAHSNLGLALSEQGNLEEAVACGRRALELEPDSAKGNNNLGLALMEQGEVEEAAACFRRAVALDPQFAGAWSNLGLALMHQGLLDESVACSRRALELAPELAGAHCNPLFTQLFRPDLDAATLYKEHGEWNRRFAAPLAKSIPPHLNDRSPDRRLRIGYVSPNFRDHCQALFTVPLLSSHDHASFEIICYADVVNPDRLTERLSSSADHWRNTAWLGDEQVAEMIRHDGIDLLVDLTMHMAHNRLLVFARKPAPVQVCWLAYPGTTGLTTIDYRLTDPYLDRVALDHQYYSEESIRLPDTFWCYDPLDQEPPVNALLATEQGYVTFGCLNNFAKINPPTLKSWAAVLRAVERSRLIILATRGTHRQRTLELLEEEGIARERVLFVGPRPRREYLEYYHGIDIGLDTVPYNGHTTSLDSYWMGVPVVTLTGPTVVGRAGLSQLTNLGLPELVASSPEQYVRIAADLAHDLPRLSQLRATLRDRMRASPLMNAPRFARNIEAAYREMWKRWCAKQPSPGA